MKKITKWLVPEENGNTVYCAPIWAAARSSEWGDIPSGTESLGYSATLRIRMLERLVRRLNEECHCLFEHAKTHTPEHVFCANDRASGCAFPVDDELKYRIMLDIDSLLFEINAAAELLHKFFGGVLAHCGTPCPPAKLGRTLETILKDAGQDTGWFTLLKRERNFFIHEGTPYLYVNISHEPYELIITKDVIRTFDDPLTFMTFSELRSIVTGFESGIRVIQVYIIDLLKRGQQGAG